jgi:hypothetical protein
MNDATRLVRLVCWNEELARVRFDEISQLGYRVNASSLRGTSAFVSHFRTLNPDAVVIDLDRLPSSGREVAIALRASKTTRHIPILFAGGVEEKVERLRSELPDTMFTSWKKIATALKRTIASPPIAPVHPIPHMERWNNASLPQKLGITAGMKVALIGGAEDGLEEIIGELPEGASLVSRIADGTRLVLYVVHALRELDAAIDHAMAKLPEGASFWIIYPKTTAAQHSDFNQNDVRELGLARAFVDYKVCSVNARWSGIKFARQKRQTRG